MIVAGEASADAHAAAMIRELAVLRPSLCVFGAGGRELSRAGAELIFDFSSVGVVGLTEIVPELGRFYRAYRSLHADRFQGVYPGIPDVLATIRGRGLPLGLVTGKSRRSWEITRELVEELGPFDTLVFDDDVRAPKPDPHGLHLALEVLGIEPAGAVYVGDTRSDMEAARAAGLRPMAALWARDPDDQVRHARRVEDVGAVLLHQPRDLLDAIDLT